MPQRSGGAPIALGAWLAARGPAATAAFVLAALETVAAVFGAYAAARTGGWGAASVPGLTAQVVAWSSGVSLAFGAAWRAAHRDREQGILALLRARGATPGAYVRGRVGGLVIVLAATIGFSTLASALAATSAASAPWVAARAGAAAMVYALAFAATLGPIAMAALGARSRLAGYLTLVSVLALPELASPWTSQALPAGWDELTSLPAALDAIRGAVAQPRAMGAHGARAFTALAALTALSVLVVAVRTSRVEAEAKTT